MGLAPYERDVLSDAHVNASGNVDSVRQSTGRWVLLGNESGGSGKGVGHYIGYAPLAGLPFSRVQPIRFVPNAMHRRVIGPVMMCFEVFRYEKNHLHARISLHSVLPGKTQTPKDSNHTRRILFQERFGVMGPDNVVTFISSAGEDKTVPAFLLDGFLRAYEGSKCVACKCCHFDGLAPIALPTELLKVFSISSSLEPV
jgi:hypothetical protein